MMLWFLFSCVQHSPKSLPCSYVWAIGQTHQILGGGHWEHVTTSWHWSWTWAIRGSFPRPCPWTVPLPTVPGATAIWGTQPREKNVSLRAPGRYPWLHPGKASVWTLRIPAGGCRDLLSWGLTWQFPCLIKLPAVNPEWCASFFGLRSPSVYKGQFQISPEVPRWWNKRDTPCFTSMAFDKFCPRSKNQLVHTVHVIKGKSPLL